MEALVSYQEGDPDRPFITALVLDPTNSTPYVLPDNKTRTTFRSNSYKSSGANEFTLEDKTAQENMFLHADQRVPLHGAARGLDARDPSTRPRWRADGEPMARALAARCARAVEPCLIDIATKVDHGEIRAWLIEINPWIGAPG